jgi:hypothetical protein
MTRIHTWGTTARRLWINPAALTYLGVVLAAVAFAVGVGLFAQGPDASFAGIWMYVTTAPVSFLFLLVDTESTLFGVLTLVLSALVQSALVGALYRAIRGRRPAAAEAPRSSSTA